MQAKNNNDNALSWDDIWFTNLLKLGDSRRAGDIPGFKHALRFFETTLTAKKDGQFEEQLTNIEYKFTYEGLEENEFLDLKADSLVSLLDRVTLKLEDITEYSDNSEVLKQILRFMQNGIGQNIMATGMPGSGKSWSCLTLAEEITTTLKTKFDPEVHIVFTLDDFWKLYNDKELCPPGSVIIFEEVGVNVNSKDFMSKANKLFGNVFQTMRYRGIAVILNTPSLGFLDKTPRSLLHRWFKTEALNTKKQYCEVRPHMVEVNQMKNDLLFPYPRLRDNQRITRLRIRKASDEVIEVYERRSKEFKDNLGKELEKEMNPDPFDELAPIEREYMERRKAGELQKIIREEFGWSQDKTSRLEKKLKKHGCIFKGAKSSFV